MAFPENLRHLRIVRNMTQEQLAMLMGVSRQSVSKWESGRAYPEVDKLLRLRDIFSCDLTELAAGDLTGSPASSAPTVPAESRSVDVLGYDRHMRRRAWMSATAVGAALLALAGASGTGAFSIVANGGAGHLSYATFPLVFPPAIAAIALSGAACASHQRFRREHPCIADFYTASERSRAQELGKEARRAAAVFMAIGTACLLVQTFALFHLYGGLASFFTTCAGAGWLLTYARLMGERVDLEAYDRRNEQLAASLGADPNVETKGMGEIGRIMLRQRFVICASVMGISSLLAIMLLKPAFPIFYLPLLGGAVLCALLWVALPLSR